MPYAIPTVDFKTKSQLENKADPRQGSGPEARDARADMRVKSPMVYAYTNYRQFLRDWFRVRKTESRHISHRSVLRQMGVTSSGFLSNVMAGKNNLTLQHIHALSRILKLGKTESQYFEALVHFTQERALEEKNQFLSRMEAARPAEMKTLRPDQFRFFEEWHLPVLRELITCMPCKDDYKEIAKLVVPRITPKQAEDGLLALEAMGLVRRNEDGVYEQVNGVVSTGDEISSLMVMNFQVETAQRVKGALENFKASQRDISVLTLGLSEETFKVMKEEVQAFRKRLLKLAGEDKNPQKVYQCAIQLFPVSRTRGEA
jgi:uncharacterized protein (TIGR02147 family)